jgi:predicted MFS family arabinose efflux permease
MFGALSLTALVYLDASPPQMGLLAAATSVPVLVLALPAGVWADRLPRVPVMVAADLGRFALLLTVPGAALLDALRIEQLYVVGFLAGALDVVFRVAYRSALPAFVSREQLVEANSALQLSEAVAASTGPAIGGGLVHTLGALIAVLIDAGTFLISGLFIRRIPPQPPEAPAERRRLGAEAWEGYRAAAGHPLLRPILANVATYSFFGGFVLTAYGLWVVDELGFSPLTLGVLLATGGIGAVAGAGLTVPFTRRLGLGRSMIVTYAVATGVSFLIPFASGPTTLSFLILLCDQTLGDAMWSVHNTQALSIRQAVTPDAQLGRVNAVFLLASQGLRPLGALVAGLFAASFGLQATLLLFSIGISLAWLWLVLSPLPRFKEAEPVS